MWGHHLCGGQFLRLQQWVETVYDADVQLTAHWTQLHLDLGFPGNGAEANLATLLREAKGWLSGIQTATPQQHQSFCALAAGVVGAVTWGPLRSACL